MLANGVFGDFVTRLIFGQGLPGLAAVLRATVFNGWSQSVGFYPVTADISEKRHNVPKECS